MTTILHKSLSFLALILLATSLHAAPQSAVSPAQALQDARQVVQARADWTLYRGAGDSMNPFFGENSLLLVAPISFPALQPGMIAVYRDATGSIVAHRVVSRTPGEAIARGFNNPADDPHTISADNLIGVTAGFLHASAPVNDDSLPVAWGKRY